MFNIRKFVYVNAPTFHVIVVKVQSCTNGSNKTEIDRGTAR